MIGEGGKCIDCHWDRLHHGFFCRAWWGRLLRYVHSIEITYLGRARECEYLYLPHRRLLENEMKI